MAIAAFDIGGTSVKYGLWNGTELERKGSFPTPKTWDEMKAGFKRVFEEFTADEEVTGAGFSFPGSVDMDKGRDLWAQRRTVYPSLPHPG